MIDQHTINIQGRLPFPMSVKSRAMKDKKQNILLRGDKPSLKQTLPHDEEALLK